MLEKGLYEQLINLYINKELKNSVYTTSKDKVDPKNLSRILALYVSEHLEKSLEKMVDKNTNVSDLVKFVNLILKEIDDKSYDNCSEIIDPPELLLSLFDSNLKTNKDVIKRPITSVAYSSLFTGSISEPKLYSELKAEILASDEIDMLVSFIKYSGLRLILNELRTFTKNGGKLKVITTTYMGATDIKSIEELYQLQNTEIKISYDTKNTRLHAKTYIFNRKTGFSTAFIGSSNLSNAAISGGLEWNIKIAGKDMPKILDKIGKTFDVYWNSDNFTLYNNSQYSDLAKALKKELKNDEEPGYIFDIKPYDYQTKILDALDADRKLRGIYKNLIVSATGTGKTVIAAFDYLRFIKENRGENNRLLFVAHRREILKQSNECFKSVLKDFNFGELYTGIDKPSSYEHLFMSIQEFNSVRPDFLLPEDYYDYIIIDEFHHAAAESYRALLNHFKPKILLGLTATPERTDGKDILKYFNGHISAEIRLPEAIDRGILSPFQYFVVTDSINLDNISWRRSSYDVSELESLYTASGNTSIERATLIKNAMEKNISDIDNLKALGFCVSVKHAKFMSDFFNKFGIPSISLSGESKKEERENAHKKLVSGEIKVIFVVDIYNEGVDIPEINTILFLRPTESLTVFMQQLGRGLRLFEGKESLTVLDFVGRANKKYNFAEKFLSLVRNKEVSIKDEIISGFNSLPRGCYIEMEKLAQEYILDNIKKSYSSRNSIIEKIKDFQVNSGMKLTLQNFLEFYHLTPENIYIKDNFSRLCVLAGIKNDFKEDIEKTLTSSMKRICQINSYSWIKTLLNKILIDKDVNTANLSDEELKMVDMFYITIWNEPPDKSKFNSALDAINSLKKCDVMYSELKELLEYLLSIIDFVEKEPSNKSVRPLSLYCSYTRNQILLAMDIKNPSTVREGVKYIPEKNIDLLFVTINKSEKHYSKTTMYKDYAINDEYFNWETQSTVSESSLTAERYFNSPQNGNTVLLFLREYRENLLGASPYLFLGSLKHKSHSGNYPVNIIWEMENKIPRKYIETVNNLLPE